MDELKLYIKNNLLRKDMKLDNRYKKIISDDMIQNIISATLACSGSIPERIHWIMNDINEYPKCRCGATIVKSDSTYTYRICCSVQCTKDAASARGKLLKNKSHEEWKIIKEKQQETNIKKYGNKNYRNLTKQKETIKILYGVTNISKLDSIKQKKAETCLNHFGYTTWSQTPEGISQTISRNKNRIYKNMSAETHQKWAKNNYLKKIFTLPSGNTILLQGYEPIVVNILLKSYNESELIFNPQNMPEIFYQINNKKHRYFPDIWIPKDNLIIEVKSTFTMQLHLAKNIAKQKRCQELGLNFKFYILDGKHNLINTQDHYVGFS